ncbi:iron-containing alcohol dehydrogenase family protein [Clostridium sp. KNHs216]|uniref:iron-containing alcohol dehydrogenase family protein n=1 Tax=Clostridium sp. KNHs216 TaxID=1550235 RepID=UPI00114DA04A|nr:iron-containing alcohol dehydrogenase family protein [Clostridium sp. KNHs216]TQI68383.1 alcohol dehydrogenase class IV [Clostridium sp. KNHs216]
MKEQFSFYMPVNIRFGNGITKELNQYVKGNSVLLICDPFLYKSGVAKTLGDAMTEKNTVYFSEIEPNPSCESVDKAARAAREIQAGCVIGLGGGSAMDVSKIVSCLVTNPGSIYDYYAGGNRALESRKAQLVLIPTTAGTGSEVTNVGVFTNQRAGIKMPMVNDCFWADCAMIDPELTYTLPPAVTASTGMDAFCHAIEAYWNKESQPLCDMLSLGALELVLKNIKKAYDTPSDKEARASMILASLTAGVSFSQTRTTGIHALSFPLTTEFGANHGTACSITLPAFIRLCYKQAKEKMEKLMRYLGYSGIDEFADAVERLMESMKMPVRLHQLGVRESDIPHIAEVGLNAAIIQLTPAEMNEETVCGLLASIL